MRTAVIQHIAFSTATLRCSCTRLSPSPVPICQRHAQQHVPSEISLARFPAQTRLLLRTTGRSSTKSVRYVPARLTSVSSATSRSSSTTTNAVRSTRSTCAEVRSQHWKQCAAFFRATFDAWKDFSRSGQESVYVGYSPIITVDAERFSETYRRHTYFMSFETRGRPSQTPRNGPCPWARKVPSRLDDKSVLCTALS